MIGRPIYLARAAPWFGKPVIKVLIGLRRSGKSVILRQIAEEARRLGSGTVLLLDMERMENDPWRTAPALQARLGGEGPGTLLIDEVQQIEGWERLAASLLAAGWDLWLTGSNAHLLSTELATLLTGRYVEIPIQPLSLPEFLTFRGANADARADLDRFLRWGGLPGLHALGFDETLCREYLRSVFDSILLNDVVRRFSVRNVPLLVGLARMLASSVGSPLSALSISKFLKSQRLSVSVETVQAYLAHLEAALLARAVRRWDIRGKRHLEVGDKYYLGDTGLFMAILDRPGDVNAVLENLVYLELLRRGCRVSVGRVGEHEVDFVAERNGRVAYVQLAYLLAEPSTVRREVRPLLALSDGHPRYLLTMDPLAPMIPEGIEHMRIGEFLGGATPVAGALG